MGSPAMPPQEFTGPQDKGINASADIPVIDLTSWNEASTQVSSSTKASQAATWHQAFSTHGLVWLVGHGLDPLYEHVAAKWKHFCQHDDAEKRKYSALWYGSSGYNKVGAEAVARSEGGDGEPDPVESLESGHQVLRSSQKQGELLSIVWFTGPNLATPLLPLPSPILPNYSSREDEIIIAGQHVMDKIKKTWS